ncbi:hypothetical protein A4R26_03020 [Niastella populi]|uniref:Uncharacterized protein n=1 Tax=Niastella populi TaxID=550983 RepID=A0A1V9FJA3_9BACT|nr:hypothetical protein A4R26_03020 [Niastella populi]
MNPLNAVLPVNMAAVKGECVPFPVQFPIVIQHNTKKKLSGFFFHFHPPRTGLQDRKSMCEPCVRHVCFIEEHPALTHGSHMHDITFIQ